MSLFDGILDQPTSNGSSLDELTSDQLAEQVTQFAATLPAQQSQQIRDVLTQYQTELLPEDAFRNWALQFLKGMIAAVKTTNAAEEPAPEPLGAAAAAAGADAVTATRGGRRGPGRPRGSRTRGGRVRDSGPGRAEGAPAPNVADLIEGRSAKRARRSTSRYGDDDDDDEFDAPEDDDDDAYSAQEDDYDDEDDEMEDAVDDDDDELMEPPEEDDEDDEYGAEPVRRGPGRPRSSGRPGRPPAGTSRGPGRPKGSGRGPGRPRGSRARGGRRLDAGGRGAGAGRGGGAGPGAGAPMAEVNLNASAPTAMMPSSAGMTAAMPSSAAPDAGADEPWSNDAAMIAGINPDEERAAANPYAMYGEGDGPSYAPGAVRGELAPAPGKFVHEDLLRLSMLRVSTKVGCESVAAESNELMALAVEERLRNLADEVIGIARHRSATRRTLDKYTLDQGPMPLRIENDTKRRLRDWEKTERNKWEVLEKERKAGRKKWLKSKIRELKESDPANPKLTAYQDEMQQLSSAADQQTERDAVNETVASLVGGGLRRPGAGSSGIVTGAGALGRSSALSRPRPALTVRDGLFVLQREHQTGRTPFFYQATLKGLTKRKRG